MTDNVMNNTDFLIVIMRMTQKKIECKKDFGKGMTIGGKGSYRKVK